MHLARAVHPRFFRCRSAAIDFKRLRGSASGNLLRASQERERLRKFLIISTLHVAE